MSKSHLVRHVEHKHVARTYVTCIGAVVVLESIVFFHKAHLTGEDILTGFLLSLTCVKELAHLILTHIWEEL